MKTGFAKAYKITSMVILGLCIYGFLLPIISPLMERLMPNIWICPFLRITGSYCPFCGITNGLSGIYGLHFNDASTVSLIVFLILLIETAFRTMMLLTMSSMRARTLKSIAVADVAYHTLLVVLVAVYVIIFIVTNF